MQLLLQHNNIHVFRTRKYYGRGYIEKKKRKEEGENVIDKEAPINFGNTCYMYTLKTDDKNKEKRKKFSY